MIHRSDIELNAEPARVRLRTRGSRKLHRNVIKLTYRLARLPAMLATMTIRPATLTDMPVISELISQLGYPV